MNGKGRIRYGELSDFPGWTQAECFISDLISRYGSRHVLEIGSGANPTLSVKYISQNQIIYTTSDLSSSELDKAHPIYRRLVIDFCGSLCQDVIGKYDFIFSRMVNEHVADGRRYHENIFKTLTDGGIAVHCFSTLYALPFLVNRLLPEAVTSALLGFFLPRDLDQRGKFPARYSWSRGPTTKIIRHLENIGFEVIEYVGFFGHPYYRRRLSALHRLEAVKSAFLARYFPLPHLTSYAYVILRKPA